jgi:hypothetical protein
MGVEVLAMPSVLPMRQYDESVIHALTVAGNDGRLLGYYRGQPIWGAVYDRDGHRYAYVGVASRFGNGRIDPTALSDSQWLVEPGLVYEWDRNRGQPRDWRRAG